MLHKIIHEWIIDTDTPSHSFSYTFPLWYVTSISRSWNYPWSRRGLKIVYRKWKLSGSFLVYTSASHTLNQSHKLNIWHTVIQIWTAGIYTLHSSHSPQLTEFISFTSSHSTHFIHFGSYIYCFILRCLSVFCSLFCVEPVGFCDPLNFCQCSTLAGFLHS